MRIFLFWISFLSVSSGPAGSDLVCPRKEPPPGTVVVSPGSELALTCGGLVKVDGVTVDLTAKGPNTSKKGSPKVTSSTEAHDGAQAEVSSTPGALRGPQHTDAGFTAAPHTVDPTGASTRLKPDYEDEEGGGESRVTRAVRSRPQWMWNKKVVEMEDRDGGHISIGRSGASLSLTSVRLTDSGKYACHHRGRERFSVKVIVADPPERPTLFCYKKSPSSKIRCEWAPQKPVVKQPHCYLLLSKRASLRPNFSQWPCSYSSQHSRCWCALDYNDDEQRLLHMAYLCVTGITGNATSDLLHFTPLDILKPDPPSNVTVQQEEGHPTRLKVAWNLPTSWKQQDSHYLLIYDIEYRPVMSSLAFAQKKTIEEWRYYIITDVIPGVEYVVQLRAKDEYDGQWSEWSEPVYERSWTVAVTVTEGVVTSVFDLNDLIEGSGSDTDDDITDSPSEPSGVPYLALWITGFFALFSVILAVYIFRFKGRFLTKLNNIRVITQFGESSAPPTSVPETPEGQALVTFGPPRYRERLPSNDERKEGEGEEVEVVEEEEQGQTTDERMEAMHFNNTSYFFFQRE